MAATETTCPPKPKVFNLLFTENVCQLPRKKEEAEKQKGKKRRGKRKRRMKKRRRHNEICLSLS